MMHGVCVIAHNPAGQVLLVRLSYGLQNWQFPGGGMADGEDPFIAAEREFSEEAGLALSDARLVGHRVEKLHGATNIIHVVTGNAAGEPVCDLREITQVGWFARDALPQNRSATIAPRLALLQQG